MLTVGVDETDEEDAFICGGRAVRVGADIYNLPNEDKCEILRSHMIRNKA
jgi:hypothetical protein